jgi:hypothetical protein
MYSSFSFAKFDKIQILMNEVKRKPTYFWTQGISFRENFNILLLKISTFLFTKVCCIFHDSKTISLFIHESYY